MLRDLIKRFNLDQLQSVLGDESRRVRLEVLERLRDSLRRQIEGIDERIASLGGKGRKRGRPARADVRFRMRPGGGTTLKEAMVATFRKAGEALHVEELAKMVKAAGYKSKATAKNLQVTIYHALKDNSLFQRVEKGVYGLKG